MNSFPSSLEGEGRVRGLKDYPGTSDKQK